MSKNLITHSIEFKEPWEMDVQDVLNSFEKAKAIKKENKQIIDMINEENLIKKKDLVINTLCEQLSQEQYKSKKFQSENESLKIKVDSLIIEVQRLIQELNQYTNNISVI